MGLNKRLVNTGGGGFVVGGEPQSFTFLGNATISGSNAPRYWHISNDGLHTIWINDNIQQLQSATLSTAWDITTASNGSGISNGNYQRGITWNYDGSQQIGFVNIGPSIVGTNLSTNYALTNSSSSITSGLGQGYSYIFEPSLNGDYFYAGAVQGIRQWTTTTGKLTSSDSYTDTTYPVAGYPTVSADGNYLFIQQSATRTNVNIYSLATAYDVTSTKTFIKTLTLPSGNSYLALNKAGKDGNYFYSYEFNSTGGRVYWWQINY